MREINHENFGLLIAFLLPGFIIVTGISLVSDSAANWLGVHGDGPTIGGFLYGTFAALGAGLIASTARWLVIDCLHHHTGIPPPVWDYRKLQKNAVAFDLLRQDHYRFYQFYANSLIALLVSWTCWRVEAGWAPNWADAAFFLCGVLCYFGSRDTLRKYYLRVREVLR